MKILDFIRDILYFILLITCTICVHFYILNNWHIFDFYGKIFVSICLATMNLCCMGYLISILFDIHYNLKIKK